jgi:hypothetical protein
MSTAFYIHILNIPQSYLTMGVMFILDLIRKEEIVVDLEAFVEG